MEAKILIEAAAMECAKTIKDFAVNQLFEEGYKQFPGELFTFKELKFTTNDDDNIIRLQGIMVFPKQHEWNF